MVNSIEIFKIKYLKEKTWFCCTWLNRIKHEKDECEILVIHQDNEHPNEEEIDSIYDYDIRQIDKYWGFIAYVERLRDNGWMVFEIKSSNSNI
jgi:hypothetical protein